ncbi:MAG: HAD-IIIC family phosphatase [Peptococcaceae bacterium]|uniref:NLI interacting factor-like phosphatase n=1 Tax=Acetivibrio saccincola TaxID=1677857 RepID=A0A2K9E0D5_9FIRM|nr:HAD-IIIC family phosphatase [Acetivibrio saccincola]AUG56839.1 NLI interacting factor-like phosphatase [Acetivibrio saccincola]NLP45220.1 HAD-IIIC family phosphatase [Peptococcaceae bacterium]NLW28112.1 HAD-IIIC family phosphatase [Acetivibrio saccincola]
MRLSVLSNINLDSLVGRLSKLNDVYKTEGYGTWVQEIINPNSGLYSFGPQAVFIIIDGEEMFKGQSRNNSTIDMNINYIEETVKNNPDITFFVSNIDLWTRKIDSAKAGSKERGLEFLWEDGLFLLSRKYRNLYVFDLKSIVEDIGREQFYSKKLWYLGGIKFSMKAEKVLEQYINRCVDSVKGKRKKCMVLDLDNTLWGGVVGEVGMEGIELSDYKEGARYKDFQKKLKEIKDLGIILAVVSKNNFDDAIKVIREHKHMVLKEEDFVALKINWDLKSQNIRDLSEELNIGLDSIVFIDDNPVERESVKRELPEVTVPGFPQDTSELLNFAVELYHNYFYTLDITDEDTVKTEIYRQNMKRRDAQKSSASYEDFLKSLETKIEIRRISAENVQRAAQLTQKTNQFNLTTKRYSEQELLALIDEEGFEGFVAYVSDRFGDNGMVSVVITKRKTDTEIELDTFLLSCRVMGRFIEEQIIGFIEDLYKKSGYKRLVTYYKPTEKNAPVKDFFERLGYSVLDVDSAGNKKYILDLEKSSIDSRKKFGELMIL